MKVSEILRMLESDGWHLVATRGSPAVQAHEQGRSRHGPWQAEQRFAPGTLNSILKQAGLK
ncbi:MAG: type II toxin-antitoxin system HicA family toxin [Gemmatimonadaceae bacterium]|nr:type II toxin-antitoxin system HicA family toxin [Gemmatimonadaceae bacterium]